MSQWNIDPTHSEIGFSVRHMMISRVRGSFKKYDVEIQGDDPTNASISVTIDAASIDTKTEDRDAHLRSADFFDVEKYPHITFKSTEIIPVGGNEYDIKGDLTIRGVTRPITLRAVHGGMAKDPWGGTRIGVEATGKLNRKDFGLTWNAALETGGVLVSDEVTINIEAEFVKQA